MTSENSYEASVLVNAVVDDVAAEAERWATMIAGYSPAAVQATKRLATFSRRLRSRRRQSKSLSGPKAVKPPRTPPKPNFLGRNCDPKYR